MILTGLIVSAICIAAMTGLSISAGLQLPEDSIPVHWNVDGVADRFVERQQAQLYLAFLPIVSILFSAVCAILPKIEPMKNNIVQSGKAYNVTWASSMILFLCIQSGIIYMMLNAGRTPIGSDTFARVIIAGSGLLFVIFGNYLPKTRQNWFLGIRTPWTLSSEFTWEKTHRFAGRLFIVAGVACLIGPFLVKGFALAILIGTASFGTLLISVVYSFFVYRTAPDKRISPDYIV